MFLNCTCKDITFDDIGYRHLVVLILVIDKLTYFSYILIKVDIISPDFECIIS